MNKLKKLQRQSKLLSSKSKDGLVQSKLSFKKEPKKDKDKSENESISESNQKDKEPLIESNIPKKGSKKRNVKVKEEKPKKKRGRPKSSDKENIEKIKLAFNNEINKIKNNLIQNENLRKENEALIGNKINKEIQDMIQIFSQIKIKREEYEENMLSQINDIIVKMKYALG